MEILTLDRAILGQDQRFRRSCFLAALVVVLYDHLLTLSSEVTYIWTPRLKRSSAWFLLFRYTAFLSNLTMIAFFVGDLSPEVCKRLSATENYLLVLQEFFVESILALRVVAMYGFNRRVFASLSIAALITAGLGAWAIVGPETAIQTTLPGCHVATPKPQAIRVAAAWEAQFVCDVLILGLTLRRAYTYHRTVGLRSGSLLSITVRDGAVYFGMICLLNLANIGMLYIGDIITAGSLAWLASSISVTMVSRLTLNLHDAAARDSVMETFDGSERAPDRELEAMRFRRSGSVRVEFAPAAEEEDSEMHV
ncbi:hypothetical protein C8R44DRAFT_988742 [Mycena epipterygia]|nr:hypothetical protein C8R44DRAFT_988742 [Mycena epipterygia]